MVLERPTRIFIDVSKITKDYQKHPSKYDYYTRAAQNISLIE